MWFIKQFKLPRNRRSQYWDKFLAINGNLPIHLLYYTTDLFLPPKWFIKNILIYLLIHSNDFFGLNAKLRPANPIDKFCFFTVFYSSFPWFSEKHSKCDGKGQINGAIGLISRRYKSTSVRRLSFCNMQIEFWMGLP